MVEQRTRVIDQSRLFIGGEWVTPAGPEVRDVISPSTEELVGRAPLASVGDVHRAVAAARLAFDTGPWPRMTMDERRAVLRKAGQLLTDRVDELDRLVVAENGTLIRTRPGSVGSRFDYFANLDLPLLERRAGTGAGDAVIVRDPVGVVAAIVPWNSPLVLAVAKVVPALLAGCTVVLKPAPETPLDPYPLAEALGEAGLPPGAFNVVAADREVSEELVRHPGVDHVSFTGSTAAGRRIASICGEQVKRVGLELGGKSAVIVLDDADLASVAPALLQGGMLLNNGEACVAWTRILVPRGRHDEVVDALCDVVRDVSLGDPFDPATDLGPLVSPRQRERVEGYIRLGVEEGARIAIGGGRPDSVSRGWYVEPTLFVDADNSMRICREEIFGPVVAVIAYDDEDDAVGIANDSSYGLGGGVFAADEGRAVAVARRLRTGTVGVNGLGLDIAFPFGGFKESGIGRQYGPEGVHEFLETKTLGFARRLDEIPDHHAFADL